MDEHTHFGFSWVLFLFVIIFYKTQNMNVLNCIDLWSSLHFHIDRQLGGNFPGFIFYILSWYCIIPKLQKNLCSMHCIQIKLIMSKVKHEICSSIAFLWKSTIPYVLCTPSSRAKGLSHTHNYRLCTHTARGSSLQSSRPPNWTPCVHVAVYSLLSSRIQHHGCEFCRETWEIHICNVQTNL